MKVLSVTSVLTAVAIARYYDDSLEDCVVFARAFSNSCELGGAYDDKFDWDSHQGTAYTCEGERNLCVNDPFVTD